MFDWENLRYFLAVAQAGSLSGAARALKVDHATVSRRLESLERALQTRLVERLPRACRLTTTGQRMFELATQMEASAFAIERETRAEQSPLTGKVTVSAPPVLVGNFLAKHLATFRRLHPGIQISLSGTPRSVSLSRLEADLAIRLVRPKDLSSVTRKIGVMRFALYASHDYAYLQNPAAWEFIAYDAQSDDMPLQQWLKRIAGARQIACEVSDIAGHHAAARAGVGIAGLPSFLGDADASLQRMSFNGEPFAMDIWMVVHRDLRRTSTIRVVMDFIVNVMVNTQALQPP